MASDTKIIIDDPAQPQRERFTAEIVDNGISISIQKRDGKRETITLWLNQREALDVGMVMMAGGGHAMMRIAEIDTRNIRTLEDAQRAFGQHAR